MSNQDDPQLRGFMKGVLNAEAAEAATGTDVPDLAIDRQRAAAMADNYGAPRRRPRQIWIATAASFSAAALVGIVLLGRQFVAPPETPLEYALDTRGNENVMGAVPDEALKHLSKSGPLSIKLRPKHDQERPVQLKVLIRSAGSCAAWPVEFEHLPNGLFRLNKPVAALPLPQTGRLDLLFALSHGQLPGDAQICELNQSSQRCGKDCQLLREQLEVDGP